VATTLAPHRARACSPIPKPPALRGFPADGSLSVPTDVVPVYDRKPAYITDPAAADAVFDLTSESGKTIQLTPRRSQVWHFELVPATRLEPRTRYTLRSRLASFDPTSEMSVSFTTGDGPLPQPPRPPLASLQHYTLDGGPLNYCDGLPYGTCVSAPQGVMVEYVDLDTIHDPDAAGRSYGPETASLFDGPFFTNLTGVNQGTNYDCLRLRTRGPNGSYSDPLVLCGRDARRYQLVGSAPPECTSSGLTLDGKLVDGPPAPAPPPPPDATPDPAQASGCSLAGPTPGSLPCLALAAMVALRRIRRGLRRRGRALTDDLVGGHRHRGR
jgi:hypothetical protein